MVLLHVSSENTTKEKLIKLYCVVLRFMVLCCPALYCVVMYCVFMVYYYTALASGWVLPNSLI